MSRSADERGQRLQAQKYQYAREIFIDTADEDYVLARWLYLNGLHRQFYWSAAQAVEKYLKAAVVLNGSSSKSFNHDIVRLYTKVKRFAEEFLPAKLKVPEQVIQFRQHPSFWGGSGTEDFVARLAEHGVPSNRYDFFGIDSQSGDFYKLDQLVFAIRRTSIDMELFVKLNGVPTSARTALRELPDWQLLPYPPKFLESKQISLEFRGAACENNFPFAPALTHEPIPIRRGGTVSGLDILFSNNVDNAALLRGWIAESIGLSTRDLQRLRSSSEKTKGRVRTLTQ
jgi:HEPN domain-containing protein